PLTNYAGAPIYGAGLSGQIWKTAMDGALSGTQFESFPSPEAIGGVAGVPQYQAPKSTTSTNTPQTTSEAPLPPAQETAEDDTPAMPRISQSEIMGVPVPVIVP